MTTNVKTDSEYLEYESPSVFRDIKNELIDEILLTEKRDVKIDIDSDSVSQVYSNSDIDSEIQKVLSGLDVINCYIQNSIKGFEDSEYKNKRDQILSSLEKIECIIKEIIKFESSINKLTELERIIFPSDKK